MRTKSILVVVMFVLMISTDTSYGTLIFNDGLVHTVDYPVPDNGYIYVEHEPFFHFSTTLNFLDDGDATTVFVRDNSIGNIEGGAVGGLLGYDYADLTMTGGTVEVVSIDEYADFTMSGGVIDTNLNVDSSSDAYISGGTINGYVRAEDYASINISGGTFYGGVYINNYSTAEISGGSIYTPIKSADSAQVTIYGNSFNVNGIDIGYGTFFGYRVGVLTGYLADGSAIPNIALEIYNNSSVTFAPGPELYTLTIQVEPNDIGIDTVDPNSGTYLQGISVELNADKYIYCPDVYQFDYWIGDVADTNSAETTIVMDANEIVTAVFVATKECGDECHPYPVGDVSKNCEVNLHDIALVAIDWLVCTKPECD